VASSAYEDAVRRLQEHAEGRKRTSGYKKFLEAGSKRIGTFSARETGAMGLAKAKYLTDLGEYIKKAEEQKKIRAQDRYVGRIT